MMEPTPSTMPFVFVYSKSLTVMFSVFTKSLNLTASLQSSFKNMFRLNCVLLLLVFVLVTTLPFPSRGIMSLMMADMLSTTAQYAVHALRLSCSMVMTMSLNSDSSDAGAGSFFSVATATVATLSRSCTTICIRFPCGWCCAVALAHVFL